MVKKTTFALLTFTLILSSTQAVIIQLDTSESPQMQLAADWSDGGSGSDSTSQSQSVFNTGSAINATNNYSLEDGDVSGEISASLTVGSNNKLAIAVDTINQDNTVGGTGSATLSPTTTWTLQLIAEDGETDGTPVDIDWYAEMYGILQHDGIASWSVSFDGVEVYSYSESVPAIASAVQFNNAEGGAVSTYSIGDSFTFSFSIEAGTTGNGSAEFYDTSALTLTATAIPEPRVVIPLTVLGVSAIFIRRRARR